jgi:uncharacterized protein
MGKVKAVGVSAAFLLSGLLLAVGGYAVLSSVLWPGRTPGVLAAAGLQSAAALAAFGAATWVFGFRVARLDRAALRWVPGGRAGLRAAGRGLLLGAAPAAVALALAVPLAGARWSPDGGSLAGWLATVGTLAASLGPAALAEEIIFRGVPLVVLAAPFGRPGAVLGLATVFAAGHLLNPGLTPLALGNIALAGVFLGTAFYLPGGLWTATGAHLGWNLTLAALAAPVSGLPLPVAGVSYWPGGPAWLTGGAFGPEGGLLVTLTLAAVTVVAARRVDWTREGTA